MKEWKEVIYQEKEESLTEEQIRNGVTSVKELNEYIEEEATQKNRPVLFNNVNKKNGKAKIWLVGSKARFLQ